MTAAIELTGVGKRYWLLRDDAMLLRSLLPFVRRQSRTEMWALRNVDFKVDEGETIGVLGRNGAGKTTMLRLLAGVSQPTEGRVRVVGRIAPLISVGVGFHPEMSGRENVFINGMLLGLTEQQVRKRFDDIVGFSEIAEFIDSPVKFYSSGMLTRLGMAVAVHVEPRIMLVDEVLAVGDLAFQAKCLDRMRALQQEGTTVVFVSHAMNAIQAMCPRSLVFTRGRLVFDGETAGAIDKHYELLAVGSGGAEQGDGADVPAVAVLHRELLGPDGPVHRASRGMRLVHRVRFRFNTEARSPQLRFQVRASDNTLVYAIRSVLNDDYRSFAAGDEVETEFEFDAQMGGGNYHLNLTVFTFDGESTLYDETRGFVVYLPPIPGSAGVTDLAAELRLDGDVRSDHPDLVMDRKQPR